MPAIFHPATPADVPALLIMMRELYDYDHSPFDETEHRRALQELLANEAYGRGWLIRTGGQTAGYLILTFGYSLEFRGRDAYIDELFVNAQFRGQGLGTAALRLAETAARSAGIKALHLLVAHSNTLALEIYRKSGYVQHDRHVMTKWLTS